MPDFFDHLWVQMNHPRESRDRAQYLARLRSLIAEAPPPCPLPRSRQPQSVAFYQSSGKSLPAKHILGFDKRSDAEFEAARLREAKFAQPSCYVVRFDPLADEAEVLESRAMGVDAYVLDLSVLDSVSAQYLIEVGIDYSCDALALCRTEEELARVLTTHLQAHVLLTGDLVAPQLLDLDLLKGRKVWLDLRDQTIEISQFTQPELIQLMYIPNSNHL